MLRRVSCVICEVVGAFCEVLSAFYRVVGTFYEVVGTWRACEVEKYNGDHSALERATPNVIQRSRGISRVGLPGR